MSRNAKLILVAVLFVVAVGLVVYFLTAGGPQGPGPVPGTGTEPPADAGDVPAGGPRMSEDLMEDEGN